MSCMTNQSRKKKCTSHTKRRLSSLAIENFLSNTIFFTFFYVEKRSVQASVDAKRFILSILRRKKQMNLKPR